VLSAAPAGFVDARGAKLRGVRPPRNVYRRRRLAALAVVAVIAFLVGLLAEHLKGEPTASSAPVTARAAPRVLKLPRGGRTLFPEHRIVAFYGAPQDQALGALGIGSPSAAGRRLERQARFYERKTRPVLPAMELLATIANAHPGDDGLYVTRQSPATIDRYLEAARRIKALLILDIQPGRSGFVSEVRRLDRWLRQPDVGLALDPEWRVGPGQVPGQVIGSVDASVINEVSDELATIVRTWDLPQKLLLVHQFTEDMIRSRGQLVERPGVALTINVDGFGDPPNKLAKYAEFTAEPPRLNDGLKLFYHEDTNLMSPRAVLALHPPPDVVVYE
jgi:hypothetical protein